MLDVDHTGFPNIALGKISRYHKSKGDTVEWYNPLFEYDKVYLSKIFTFTPDYGYYINSREVEKGGTGYDLHKILSEDVDRVQPDYSIYPQVDGHTAYGFLTRGCPNKCRWCVVPVKEGQVRPYMDVEEIAKILSRVKWLNKIRFGCDTPKQIADCERAMQMIDKYRDTPACYLMYTMINSDIEESYSRVSHFRENKRVRIVAQPYRDFNNNHQIIPQWQKDMSRWAMRREIYFTCDFKDYEPRKGFLCSKYFQ